MVDTDGGGLTGSKAVVLSITDVNEAPTVTSGATASVAENSPASTVVYTATATDPDTSAPFNTKAWIFTGADAALLSINSSGQVTLNAPADFETKNSYSFNVVDTDGGGLTATKAVVLSITNVNEAPTAPVDNNPATNLVSANAAIGTTVGIIANSTDPDSGDTLTYSLSTNPNNLFAINSTTGVVTVADSADLNTGSYTVGVTATDNHGLAGPASSFTVGVAGLEFSLTGLQISGLEQGSTLNKNTAIGTFAVAGVTGGYTFSLPSTADNNHFVIDPSTGLLSTGGSNVPGGATYHLTVTATLSGSPTLTIPVTAFVGTTGADPLSAATGTNLFFGLNGNDTITGGSGFDAIVAGAGVDTVTGGGSGDFLAGGSGADTFKYLHVTDSQGGLTANGVAKYDTIADFSSGTDKIDLSGGDFAAATLSQPSRPATSVPDLLPRIRLPGISTAPTIKPSSMPIQAAVR